MPIELGFSSSAAPAVLDIGLAVARPSETRAPRHEDLEDLGVSDSDAGLKLADCRESGALSKRQAGKQEGGRELDLVPAHGSSRQSTITLVPGLANNGEQDYY
ncbi:hypothetical protein M432DRAFT_641691 [Thermoascus aurantiacus ATCC 26904]